MKCVKLKRKMWVNVRKKQNQGLLGFFFFISVFYIPFGVQQGRNHEFKKGVFFVASNSICYSYVLANISQLIYKIIFNGAPNRSSPRELRTTPLVGNSCSSRHLPIRGKRGTRRGDHEEAVKLMNASKKQWEKPRKGRKEYTRTYLCTFALLNACAGFFGWKFTLLNFYTIFIVP